MSGGRQSLSRKCLRLECVSRSPEETQELGRKLGCVVSVPGVILLRGALGSGKTTLTRGIAVGLGLKDASLVSSPSFALVNIYQGRCRIYHVDLYRLSGARDLYSIGLDDFVGSEGITVVEWGEKLTFPIEPAALVELEDAGEDTRRICISCPAANRRRLADLGRSMMPDQASSCSERPHSRRQ